MTHHHHHQQQDSDSSLQDHSSSRQTVEELQRSLSELALENELLKYELAKANGENERLLQCLQDKDLAQAEINRHLENVSKFAYTLHDKFREFKLKYYKEQGLRWTLQCACACVCNLSPNNAARARGVQILLSQNVVVVRSIFLWWTIKNKFQIIYHNITTKVSINVDIEAKFFPCIK